jgi:4-hydroxymandelate oxidase
MPKHLADLLTRHEQTARAKLPPEASGFVADASGEEISLRESTVAWRSFRLRPHVLRDVSTVDTSTTVMDTALRSPVVVAPVAFQELLHAAGEVETARGVSAAGGLMVVPTRATKPLADIAAALSGPWWFQVYVVGDHALTERIVRNAAALGARALMLTGDTPLLARRRGGDLPPASPEQLLAPFREHLQPDADPSTAIGQDPSLTLDTVGWLHQISGLPILVKGVLRGDDAIACIDAGAAGVVVSNHGGRQLDRAVASAYALTEVVEAVGGRGAMLVDGGIRSGIDVLIALAMGADAVMLGRPVQWALAAEGSSGVERLLGAFSDELAHVMALARVARVVDVDRSVVVSPQPGGAP